MATVIQSVQIFLFCTLRPVLKFFLNAQVVGVDQIFIDSSKPLIVVANHQAKIDPYLLLLLPYRTLCKIWPVYFPTAEEYCNHTVIGPIIKIMGAYPMKKWGVTVDDFLGDTLRYLTGDKTIMMFPEARLTDRYSENSAKSGVVRLALKTNASIVPMHIDGIAKLTLSDFFSRRRNLKVTFGRPVDIRSKEDTRFEYKKIADTLLQNIYSL
jgi:1-acyl-sn-glycerol-3-phosphate acyltransferase